ncbi:MAG: TlyA family RNA methyltransferase, partial [Planctomycetes bacterium]|nr:TlyA family RNA methyltransferase [Planctomycetota bacterium]
VDCLLQRGARKVFAVDTSYGTLAWRLRRDPRVVVLERTNALHVTLPEAAELVTIDVGWTRQINVMPNVAKLMHDEGRVVSLIKPHYEASPDWLWGGVLPDDRVDEVVAAVLEELASIGWVAIDHVASALRGRAGNREFFALFAGPAGVTDRS